MGVLRMVWVFLSKHRFRQPERVFRLPETGLVGMGTGSCRNAFYARAAGFRKWRARAAARFCPPACEIALPDARFWAKMRGFYVFSGCLKTDFRYEKHPQLLHHRPHRPRKIHPCRPLYPILRRLGTAQNEHPGAGQHGYRKRARHHD